MSDTPDTPVFIAAHSLGAASGYLYAYSRIKRGLRVDGIYPLAPPNPGNKVIGDVLTTQGKGVLIRALKNRRDLVTDVPVDIEFLGEQYVQPRAFEELDEKSNDTGPFKDHHIELYQAGAHKLTPSGAAIEIADAADLVARLYLTADGWDWVSPIDGAYWAMKVMPNGAKLMIRRGSKTALDWLDDFDAVQDLVMGARVSRGFWRGVAAVQDELDSQLA